MDNEQIELCEQKINYVFENKTWISKALTHSSSKTTDRPSNERLEFLGDAVLGLVISEHLFHKLKGRSEGELTKIKSRVVSRVALARRSRSMGMENCISVGKGMFERRSLPMSVMANVMEAIIGAVFVDGGLEPARKFILDVMADELDEAIINQESGNFKSMLQQFAQRVFSSTPKYEVLQHSGPDHSKKFHVIALIGEQQYESAWGRSKKEAEQRAAELTFLSLTSRPETETPAIIPPATSLNAGLNAGSPDTFHAAQGGGSDDGDKS